MKLTQEYLLSVIDYDKDTGLFKWKGRRSGVKSGSIAGTLKVEGYIQIKLLKKYHYGHRLAWLYVHGSLPAGEIDHIDGDKKNNAISNLRDVSKAGNMGNIKKAFKTNTSGLLGAYHDKRKGTWYSQITANGKRHCLGVFATADEAHGAYLTAKRELHQGCTI